MTSKPTPEPVAEALRHLIRVTADHGIEFKDIIESPDARTVREAKEHARRSGQLIDRLRKRVKELEDELGIEDDL